MKRLVLIALFVLLLVPALYAQSNTANFGGGIIPFQVNLGVQGSQKPQDADVAIRILFIITLLTLAPSIILLMTCFTRIVIVLSFVRTALSLQGTPANQIIIGLSLFLTFFIMAPVWDRIDHGRAATLRRQPNHQRPGHGPGLGHISAPSC